MKKIITSITVKMMASVAVSGLISAGVCLGGGEPSAPANAWTILTPAFSSTNAQSSDPVAALAVAASEPGTNPPSGTPSPRPQRATAVPPPVPQLSPDIIARMQRAALHGPLRATNTHSPSVLFSAAREKMVEEQLTGPGRAIATKSVLEAMGTVPRQSFLPYEVLSEAYMDKPVDIRYGRMMESPYVVASVAEQVASNPAARVLEIGTGSGYQAAVLSRLVKEVYTTEANPILARRAAGDLRNQGFTNNLFVRTGDPALGWPEAAPFDAIIVNGSTNEIPETLKSQLKEGGQLIIPVDSDGNLKRAQKAASRLTPQIVRSVRPVPVAGNAVELPPVAKVTPVQTQVAK